RHEPRDCVPMPGTLAGSLATLVADRRAGGVTVRLSRIERAPPALRRDLGTDDREILAKDVVPQQARTRNAVHPKHARLPDRQITGEHVPDGRLEQQAMRLDMSTRAAAVAVRVAERETASSGEGIVEDPQKLVRGSSRGSPHVIARRRADDDPAAQSA